MHHHRTLDVGTQLEELEKAFLAYLQYVIDRRSREKDTSNFLEQEMQQLAVRLAAFVRPVGLADAVRGALDRAERHAGPSWLPRGGPVTDPHKKKLKGRVAKTPVRTGQRSPYGPIGPRKHANDDAKENVPSQKKK